MKAKFIIPLAILYIVGISCASESTENTCISDEITVITEVNAPQTGNINEPITIEVTAGIYNGCGSFNKFIETEITQHTLIIEAEAHYEGCVCTQIAMFVTKNYEFTPKTPGNYLLKFSAREGEFIEVNIAIN